MRRYFIPAAIAGLCLVSGHVFAADPGADEPAKPPLLTGHEIDQFRQQLAICWTPPLPKTGEVEVVVGLTVFLDPDGSVSSIVPDEQPKQLRAVQLAAHSSVLEAAVRALERCQPYKMPPEKYASWSEVQLKFIAGLTGR